MSVSLIFLIIAGICFLIEAVSGRIAVPIKWWALGVAFYLFSLAAA
jgi:hypothetical protein